MQQLAKPQRGCTLQTLIQRPRREKTAVGTPKRIAVASNRRNYQWEVTSARARTRCLPTATISDAIANKRHCIVHKAGPDKVTLLAGTDRAILRVQDFEE